MKNMIQFILMTAVCVFSVDHISAPYTAVPGASVSSSGWNSNTDTLVNGVNRVADTLNTLTATVETIETDIDSIETSIADSVGTRVVTADSIYINGVKIKPFYSSLVPCSLFDGVSYRATQNGYILVYGQIKILTIPYMLGTITASTDTYIKIPEEYWPTDTLSFTAPYTYDTSNDDIGRLTVDFTGGTKFKLREIDDTYIPPGTGGMKATTVTYY